MAGIDWTNTPLEDFLAVDERQQDGTFTQRLYPFGEGEAQRLMVGLFRDMQNAYEKLLPADDTRYEATGRVPVIRDGERGYEPLSTLTLRDLPVVLDTLMVLEEEAGARSAEERKTRRRELERERRKRKKLGEW